MHLAGTQNMAVDFLSWQHPYPGEWKLHPKVAQVIWHRHEKEEVDLFTSQSTAHSPLWFPLRETNKLFGPRCSGLCDRFRLYAFLPLLLILPTLDRILRGNREVVLMVPKWPGRVWFPILHKVLDREPWWPPFRLYPPLTARGSNLAPEPILAAAWDLASKGPEPLLGSCDAAVVRTIRNSRVSFTNTLYASRKKMLQSGAENKRRHRHVVPY